MRNATSHLALSTALIGILAGSASAADSDLITEDLLFAAVFGASVGGQDARATEDDLDMDEGTELTFAGQGLVSFPLGVAFSAQLDAQAEFYDRASGGQDNAQGASMVGAHLSLRDPSSGLFGFFAGAGLGDNNGSSGRGEDLGYLAGVEAQGYLGDFTFYGQAGYADFVVDNNPAEGSDDEGFVDGWFAGAEARYFIHEDFMLHANVAFGWTSQYGDGDEDGEIWNWGAGGKLLLSDSMPIYGTADYRGGIYADVDFRFKEVTEHAFLAGLSFLFGAPSLLENDRRGATLSTPMLPARAAAWNEAVD